MLDRKGWHAARSYAGQLQAVTTGDFCHCAPLWIPGLVLGDNNAFD